MPAKKKDFTTADGAVDRFFAPQQAHDANAANIANDGNICNVGNDGNNDNVSNVINNGNIDNDSNVGNVCNVAHTAKPPNVSKHYEERGRRAERFVLLLDERLKRDLKHLSMASGSKSVNDFIVTLLLECVEREDSQAKLERYRNLLGG